MKNILFVCLGNICRSPAAEGVMLDLLEKRKLLAGYEVDSAGTSQYHAGSLADPRMREHAQARNIKLTSRSRRFDELNDFRHFDYIIAMDRQNLKDLSSLDQKEQFQGKLYLMSEFAQKRSEIDVPDPYYGGEQGFETVLDIVTDCCEGLILHLESCLLYTSPSPRDATLSRMPSSA